MLVYVCELQLPQATPFSPGRLWLYLCLIFLTVFVLIQIVHEHLTIAGKVLVVLTTDSLLRPLNEQNQDLVMSHRRGAEKIMLQGREREREGEGERETITKYLKAEFFKLI